MIIDKEIDIKIVESKLDEANQIYIKLSAVQDKDSINTIIENMLKDDVELSIALASINENVSINEFITKHVTAAGDLIRKQDKKTRQRKAFQTTGLSKSKRREIARKAVKTKRSNPAIIKKAVRATKKAIKKRRSLYGLK